MKKSIKYHLKIISRIVNLNFNDYLLKYSHWHSTCRAGHSLIFSRFAIRSPLNFFPWIADAHAFILWISLFARHSNWHIYSPSLPPTPIWPPRCRTGSLKLSDLFERCANSFFDNSLITLHSFSFTQKIKDHSSLLSVCSIYKSDVPSSAFKWYMTFTPVHQLYFT